MFQRSQVSADALWRRHWQNGNPKMCDGPTNIWHGQVLETLVCLKISRGLSAIALLSCLDLLGPKQINRPRLFLRETPSDPWASLLSCFESFGIADHLHQCIWHWKENDGRWQCRGRYPFIFWIVPQARSASPRRGFQYWVFTATFPSFSAMNDPGIFFFTFW